MLTIDLFSDVHTEVVGIQIIPAEPGWYLAVDDKERELQYAHRIVAWKIDVFVKFNPSKEEHTDHTYGVPIYALDVLTAEDVNYGESIYRPEWSGDYIELEHGFPKPLMKCKLCDRTVEKAAPGGCSWIAPFMCSCCFCGCGNALQTKIEKKAGSCLDCEGKDDVVREFQD